MPNLVSAIQDLDSRASLSHYHIDNLIRAAAEHGVQPYEVRQILDCIEATEQGLTPRIRAQLLVRLEARDQPTAVAAVPSRPASWGEVERLNEVRARIEFMLDEASTAHRGLSNMKWQMDRLLDPEALAAGRIERRSANVEWSEFSELKTELRDAQRRAVVAYARLRAGLEATPAVERQLTFASLQHSARTDLRTATNEVEPECLVGMSKVDVEALGAPLADLGLVHDGSGTDRVAGLTFAQPVAWTFVDGSNRFQLPAGTVIRTWPAAGDFQVEGVNLTLPSGHLVNGIVRVKDGAITFPAPTEILVAGLPLHSRGSAAQVRSSGDSVIAVGPDLTIPLPVVNAEGEPLVQADAETHVAVEQPVAGQPTDGEVPAVVPPSAQASKPQLTPRQIRFTATETTLADGTEIRRGSGQMTVLFAQGVAVGVLEGSTRLNPGALVYQRSVSDEGADNTIADVRGERGQLERGAAVFRDNNLIGFVAASRATVDGLEIQVGHQAGDVLASYAPKPPHGYAIGEHMTVTKTPAGRAVELRGRNFEVALGDVIMTVVAGGVVAEGGAVTRILPGSEVQLKHGVVKTSTGAVELLAEEPETMPAGNAVYLSLNHITASGDGFRIEGLESGSLLVAGEDQSFGKRPLRNAIDMRGGSLRIRAANDAVRKPGGLEAYDVVGKVSVMTGAWTLESDKPGAARASARGSGGPMMWVQLGDQRYEIDTRPMGEDCDPIHDPGRVRQVRAITNGARFGGALAGLTTRLMDGELEIPAASASQYPQLMRQVRETLSYFLGRPIGDHVSVALEAFQRLCQLDVTGVIDARTMRMLDELSPPAGQPQVFRPEGTFGGAIAGQVGALIAGQLPAMRYRRGTSTVKGELVTRVQQTLRAQGFAIGVDGMLGPGMTTALCEFQRRHPGLAQTGAIDAATLRKMVELTGTELTPTMKPRQKTMVMVVMNDEVKDELRRFRELAALRGATAIIIGPPDQEYQKPIDLVRYLARAERGEIDLDWLVFSGHSTGTSTWGKYGRLEYRDLETWAKQFPRTFGEIEKLSLLNCYNVTPEKARNYWPSLFPNLVAAAGFMYSAPGAESQVSDEFLLNSGEIMNALNKGEMPEKWTAQRMAQSFERDPVILYQNAAIALMVPGETVPHFGMTGTARREMEKHGAQEQLRAIPPHLVQAYENYFKAESDEFAEPPHGHDSVLRQYLGAVQHVLDGWQGRIRRYTRWLEERDRFMAPHLALREGDANYPLPDYDTPEEFGYASGWQRQYEEIKGLRAKILSLVKMDAIARQYGLLYAPATAAFNDFLAARHDEKFAEAEDRPDLVLLPSAAEMAHMNRKQIRERLAAVQKSLNHLDWQVRSQLQEGPAWQIMVGCDPTSLMPATPDVVLNRAVAFLDQLDAKYIAPEWLDETLLQNDLRRLGI